MKGYVANKGKVKFVEDNEPIPEYPPDTTELEMEKAKLKDEILEKIILDEDITNLKMQYKNLKTEIKEVKGIK